MHAISNKEHPSVLSTLSTDDVKNRVDEAAQVIDIHLARITRLQMLLNLEEARLLRAHEEKRELEVLLFEQP